MTDDDVCGSATDEQIDAALASLTDAAPSRELHARVMRRIADVPCSGRRSSFDMLSTDGSRRATFGWRLALTAAAVLLIAVSIWSALRPAQGPQIATLRTPAPDVTLPAGEPGGSAVDRQDATAPESKVPAPGVTAETGSRAAIAVTARHRRATDRRPDAGREVGQQAEVVDDFLIPALPSSVPLSPPDPVQMAPLPDPAPVTMTPVSIPPIEMPEIDIRPIDEPPNSASGPAKPDSNRNSPGAAMRGATQ